MNLNYLPVLAVMACSGCAVYHIKPIPPGEATVQNWGKSGRDGYVIYQPELYFLVTVDPGEAAPAKEENPEKDAKGKESGGDNSVAQPKLTVQPVYYPNKLMPYRVNSWSCLAKADFSFKFEDGWKLTSLDNKSDTSGLATALAGQAASLVSAFGGGAAKASLVGVPQAGKPERKKVFLFHPEFDHNGLIRKFTPVPIPVEL